MRADEHLKSAAATFAGRNATYGDSYRQFGNIMMALFPDGVELRTKSDMDRMGVLIMMVSKINRYCNNFSVGGHPDSTHDLSVYSAMLSELDDERRAMELSLEVANAADAEAERHPPALEENIVQYYLKQGMRDGGDQG